jgi:hypothetical protein
MFKEAHVCIDAFERRFSPFHPRPFGIETELA